MAHWQYHATADAVAELLNGGGEFNTPERILLDLSAEQAYMVPPGSPHSIAQIVAHTHFWQEKTIAHQQGEPAERPERLADSFAAPPPEEWETLVANFLAGIGEVRRLAAEKADAASPDREDTSVPYDLAESALHNAYHLGQVVLLRQIQGLWPPADGDVNDY